LTAAQSALIDYAESVVNDAKPGILIDAFRGSSLKAFFISLGAAFVYTLILISFVVILKTAGVDLVGIVEKIGRP
jgi:hypothetical protein